MPSKHPLSDEKTSKIDERLIGAVADIDRDKPEEYAGQVLIGKRGTAENVLEAVDLQFDDQSHVVVNRVPMSTTTVGELHLFSTPEDVFGKHDPKEYVSKDYEIFMYAMPDADTVNVYFMDNDVIGASVANKELSGSVSATYFFGSAQYSASTIKASPEELRKYIERTGKKCFDSDAWFTLKRARAK